MKITAFDLSLTATGWAQRDDAGISEGLIKFPKLVKTPVHRLAAIRHAVSAIAHGSDLVITEGYAFGRTNRAHNMGELGGVVRVQLIIDDGITVVVIPPPVLKKFATGRGNAGKSDVLVAAVRRLGLDNSDHNIADAHWLLAMAMCHHGVYGAPAMPATQLAVLEKVDWSGQS